MRQTFRVMGLLMVFCMVGSAVCFAAVCPNCGYDNKEGYKYCIKCGTRLDGQPQGQQGGLKAEESLTVASRRLAGPKKTIAVIGFENTSGFNSYIHLGDDFTAQLTDALIQSGQFTVVSRSELDKIFLEQDLASSGRMAKSLAAQKGKAIPAQILIKGSITEFEEQSSAGSQGLTIHGVTIGGSKSQAHIAVIVQIIDSTTGEVLNSRRVEGKSSASGFDIGYSGSWSLGSSSFKKTPLGKATQIAIDNAVSYIADEIARLPWQGRVVKKEGDIVYINAGSNSGITSGMNFIVYRPGESLIDPETGENLGSEKTKIGEISVFEVQQKFSKARLVSSTSDIQAADIVSQQ